ncbi:hypothetical protein [Polyangium aurulentum]|uniref:hypothetical protein n=1 Tax=Polyangium aurulentum TaxID=2567896 RepID=UPI0010ADDAD9|nr:hypothetical protein [Polyangium aurulentum]UQA54720.1 hypothetical protein E8A73_025445 [Polyangium aurulentum]
MARTTFEVEGARLDAATFAARHPAWVRDPAALRALVRTPRGLALPPLPAPPRDALFDPWRDAMLAIAAPRQELKLGSGPVKPKPDGSFAHGTAAFLPSSHWPVCGRCSTHLELCLQLAPSMVGPWLHRPGALVLMYCFACLPGSPETTYLRIVEPRTLATRPAGPTASSSHTSTTQTRGVTVLPPSWRVPDSMWFRYRLDGEDLGGAAAVLLGREEIVAETEGEDGEDEEVGTFDAYDEWAERFNARGRRGDGALGGYPNWEQDDATPACPACRAPMEHLLDWNGEQFLDGALHVFMCERTPACGKELEFVAEF